jgi:tetratricopeptide (TPR) repeat protein
LRDNSLSLQQSAERIEDVDSFLTNYGDDGNFSEQIRNQRLFYVHYTEAVINAQQAIASRDAGDYLAQAEYANAAMAANEAILDTGANDAYAHRRLGSIRMARNEPDLAVYHLEQSVELNPTDVPTWIDLGNLYDLRGEVYLKMGDLDLAIADYSKAIELYPEDDLAYAFRASCYIDIGGEDKIALALEDLERAIAFNSNNAVAYFLRGQIHHNRGDRSRAIADYTKVIELVPADAVISGWAQTALDELANE